MARSNFKPGALGLRFLRFGQARVQRYTSLYDSSPRRVPSPAWRDSVETPLVWEASDMPDEIPGAPETIAREGFEVPVNRRKTPRDLLAILDLHGELDKPPRTSSIDDVPPSQPAPGAEKTPPRPAAVQRTARRGKPALVEEITPRQAQVPDTEPGLDPWQNEEDIPPDADAPDISAPPVAPPAAGRVNRQPDTVGARQPDTVGAAPHSPAPGTPPDRDTVPTSWSEPAGQDAPGYTGHWEYVPEQIEDLVEPPAVEQPTANVWRKPGTERQTRPQRPAPPESGPPGQVPPGDDQTGDPRKTAELRRTVETPAAPATAVQRQTAPDVPDSVDDDAVAAGARSDVARSDVARSDVARSDVARSDVWEKPAPERVPRHEAAPPQEAAPVEFSPRRDPSPAPEIRRTPGAYETPVSPAQPVDFSLPHFDDEDDRETERVEYDESGMPIDFPGQVPAATRATLTQKPQPENIQRRSQSRSPVIPDPASDDDDPGAMTEDRYGSFEEDVAPMHPPDRPHLFEALMDAGMVRLAPTPPEPPPRVQRSAEPPAPAPEASVRHFAAPPFAQEPLPSAVPDAGSPEADLLKLLDLPPDTPVVNLRQTPQDATRGVQRSVYIDPADDAGSAPEPDIYEAPTRRAAPSFDARPAAAPRQAAPPDMPAGSGVVQRAEETAPSESAPLTSAPLTSAPLAGEEPAEDSSAEKGPNIDKLAREVYRMLRNRLRVEQERRSDR